MSKRNPRTQAKWDRAQTRNEWIQPPSELNLSGVWQIQAHEEKLKSHDSLQIPSKAEGQIVDIPNKWRVHNEPIQYEKCYAYWGEIHIRALQQKGFYFGKGKLRTNTGIEVLEESAVEFVCSFRKTDNTLYLNGEYELFPKEGVMSPRTFGYATFLPPNKSDPPPLCFRGYYLTNRMRAPIELANDYNDTLFKGIALGRVVLFKA